MDIVSAKKTNTIATNPTKTCHSIETRHIFDCYILLTVLLTIILLLMITIICYYFAKHKLKQTDIDALTIQKWKIKFILKIVRVIILMINYIERV